MMIERPGYYKYGIPTIRGMMRAYIHIIEFKVFQDGENYCKFRIAYPLQDIDGNLDGYQIDEYENERLNGRNFQPIDDEVIKTKLMLLGL